MALQRMCMHFMLLLNVFIYLYAGQNPFKIFTYVCSSVPNVPCFDSQLKAFGAKLKERNNLFRKRSKAQSHDMKEVLYSNLVQANLVRGFTHEYFISMATF